MDKDIELKINMNEFVKYLEKIVEAIVDERIKEHDSEINRRIVNANYKTAKRLAETGDANLVAEEHKKLLGIYLD